MNTEEDDGGALSESWQLVTSHGAEDTQLTRQHVIGGFALGQCSLSECRDSHSITTWLGLKFARPSESCMKSMANV